MSDDAGGHDEMEQAGCPGVRSSDVVVITCVRATWRNLKLHAGETYG